RAVDRRDAAADALARVDRDREGGPEGGAVLAHHHREPELVASLRGERQTDEPAAVDRHEVDVLGGDALGGDAEVALVLAVLVVHEDDHAPGPQLGERLLDADDVRALPARRHDGAMIDAPSERGNLGPDGPRTGSEARAPAAWRAPGPSA